MRKGRDSFLEGYPTYRLHFDFRCRHLIHAREIRFIVAGVLVDEGRGRGSMEVDADPEGGFCSELTWDSRSLGEDIVMVDPD